MKPIIVKPPENGKDSCGQDIIQIDDDEPWLQPGAQQNSKTNVTISDGVARLAHDDPTRSAPKQKAQSEESYRTVTETPQKKRKPTPLEVWLSTAPKKPKPKNSSASRMRPTSLFQDGPLPRISQKLKVSELREEAICRGYDPKCLPKLKGDLLHFLLVGSVHLKETKAWKRVEALKAQIESERDVLYEKSLVMKQEAERKRGERHRARLAKQAEKMRSEEEVKRTQEETAGNIVLRSKPSDGKEEGRRTYVCVKKEEADEREQDKGVEVQAPEDTQGEEKDETRTHSIKQEYCKLENLPLSIVKVTDIKEEGYTKCKRKEIPMSHIKQEDLEGERNRGRRTGLDEI